MDDGGFEATAEQHLLGSFEGEWEEDEEVSIDQIMEAIRSRELNVNDLLEEEQHPLIGLNRCILGSILSLGPFFVRSLAASLLQFAVLSAVANDRLANLLTSLAGLVLLWANSENRPFLVLPLLLFFALSSSLINYPKATRLDRGFLCVLLSIAFIVACEFSLEAMDFMTIRGQLMIAAMKQISLCFDLEVTEERESKEVKTANGTNDHQQREDDKAPFHSPAKATAADLFAQLAFVFQPSTLLFGPFICWPQFEQIHRDAKQHWRRPKDLLVHWLLLIRHLAQAFLFLLLSTCLLDPHSQLLFPTLKLPWLIRHFLTALSFRCSHYFVCHFSAATALLGGQQSPLEVVRWQSIEWPHSMAQVAAHWNVPMHTFLRKYVFNRANHRMGLFPAVLLTFAVSAALHGLDIQMAAVLLSLGLWAFVERRFRSRLASTLSACVGTRDCLGECQHRLKKLNPMVVGLRLLFVAFNIFQLIYLGAPFYGDGQFQGYSLGHLWQVWAHEFWLSGHLTCLAIFIGTSLISKQKRE